MAREYLANGREIHRLAFERHMGGMLTRMKLEAFDAGKEDGR